MAIWKSRRVRFLTVTIPAKVSIGGAAVDVDESSISWHQDRDHKYAQVLPSSFQTNPDLRGGAGMNTTLDKDEHFIVWMRPATLPNFRKLWGRIERDITQGTVLDINIDNRCSLCMPSRPVYVVRARGLLKTAESDL